MGRNYGLSEESLNAESRLSGRYVINKFGRNFDVDAAEDICDVGGDYNGWPTSTAETFQVVSSSANDTSAGTGARTIRIYYLDSNYNAFDSSGNFLYTDLTLNGTSNVNSTVTGMRVWRAKVLTAGSGTTNAGTITIRWTTTTAHVFSIIPIGHGQTHITAFTVPLGYSLYIREYGANIFDTTTNKATLEFKIREFGGAVQLANDFSVSDSTPSYIRRYGGIKYDARTDLLVRCTAVQNANADIAVYWDGILVKD